MIIPSVSNQTTEDKQQKKRRTHAILFLISGPYRGKQSFLHECSFLMDIYTSKASTWACASVCVLKQRN